MCDKKQWYKYIILKVGENLKKESEDYDVVIPIEELEDGTTVMTISETKQKWIETAVRNYDAENKIYSAYLNELSYTAPVVTKEVLDSLAVNAQNDLNKIVKINNIARIYVNKDWIVGKVVETIDTNVNSEFRLSYKKFDSDEMKLKELIDCKNIVDDFNEKINLRRLIKNSVPTAFTEGNYIFYCRVFHDGRYDVSWYPLGVAEISDYNINGEPQVLINIKELVARLKKTIKRTKKNKALFFDKLKEEIKANYPTEVYEAYINGDSYAKLDPKWTGVIRINNQNRRYGVTPIFRALYPALMLEQFDNTDRVNAKAKAKKFIVQLLNEKLLGEYGDKDSFEEQAYAHQNLMEAFKQKTVLVTAPAFVKEIKYVEPTTTNTDTDTVINYVNRELSTLGISFLMSSGTTGTSTASISLAQLMKTINSITEQLEFILEKWYKNILIYNGHTTEFAPNVRILDSELLEMDVKEDLAKLLYCNFNSSMETALSILGLDINDEKAKREKENKENLHEIFFPRSTAYTSSGKGNILPKDVDNKSGRPKEDNIETIGKREYDELYNKNARV